MSGWRVVVLGGAVRGGVQAERDPEQGRVAGPASTSESPCRTPASSAGSRVNAGALAFGGSRHLFCETGRRCPSARVPARSSEVTCAAVSRELTPRCDTALTTAPDGTWPLRRAARA